VYGSVISAGTNCVSLKLKKKKKRGKVGPLGISDDNVNGMRGFIC